MVPVRLTLRNFLSYRENCPALDFTGVSLACLSGENGHGKSALLDAITWSVWGHARSKGDDELIHVGRVDMEVEFEFRVGEVVYRTLRKRRKGTVNSPGRTLLEFQVLSDGSWKALTGNTVRDTQARIIDAVRLDYDTFCNSAFLMQGRADEFTLKAPGERKRVLAEILGLSAYDGYETQARDERRRWDAEARRHDAVIDGYARELEREPQYVRERGETLEELASIESDLNESRKHLAALQEAQRTLQLLRSQAETAERDRAQAFDRIRRSQLEAQQQLAIVGRCEATVGCEAGIRNRFQAIVAARAVESEQSRRLAVVVALRQTESEAQAAIEHEAARLRSRQSVKSAEIERLRALAGREPEITTAVAALAAERSELELTERRLSELRQELQEQTNAAGQLQAANKRLRSDMDEMKSKQTELRASDGATCPVCRTELGESVKQRICDSYEAEGKELAAQHRVNKGIQDTAERRCLTIKADIRRDEEKFSSAKTAYDRKQAGLERDQRDAANAIAALPPLMAEHDGITTALAAGQFAAEARERLAQIADQLRAIAYNEAAHHRARTDVKELAGAEAEHTELQLAEESMRSARAALARIEQDTVEWRTALEQAERRAAELKQLLDAHADPTAELVQVSGNVSALEQSEKRLRLALGAAEQNLENCRRYRRLHDLAQVDRLTARTKRQIFEDLSTAFGKKGVQALIIDAVIPEIEEEANRLLNRMSNGRMSVALSTQRQTLKGTTSETLDIPVADELGTRSYELFSGGEAFRINLALRIALSKLLARRAGAPLPTLIVDEGFGTQDAAGRERLLEAMNAVARDFECLIVITHIDELKDQFDRQIRVEKRPEGSYAWIE